MAKTDWWEKLLSMWGVSEEPPLTNPTTANDIMVEDAIVQFQLAAQTVTDKLAEISSANADKLALLDKYREAVTVAYAHCMNGLHTQAEAELKKVVGK